MARFPFLTGGTAAERLCCAAQLWYHCTSADAAPAVAAGVVLSCSVQVVDLEGVFQLLRGDVERLFLQAPCVDLDALGQQLAEAEGRVEEQASMVQVGGCVQFVYCLAESVASHTCNMCLTFNWLYSTVAFL